jgi:hypothetical protein
MPFVAIHALADRLQGLIQQCRAARSRTGYFAALYRHITLDIAVGLEAGEFARPESLERLAVAFADRYLAAVTASQAGSSASRCWRLAFSRGERDDLLIVQHLILAMNAHINFDLGVATAETAGNRQHLQAMKADFDKLNDLLATRVDEIEGRIAGLSPRIGFLDELLGDEDETVAGFSIRRARADAWSVANALVELDGLPKEFVLTARDALVTGFGQALVSPLVNIALRPILDAESSSVVDVIDALAA